MILPHPYLSPRKMINWPAILILLAAQFAWASPVQADIAPPGYPPGADLAPDNANTRVRMMSETVTLTVLRQSATTSRGQARVVAEFTLRNLGNAAERINVRFPLNNTFWRNSPIGAEIKDLVVRVSGAVVPTSRVNDPRLKTIDGKPVAWSAFTVSFPPNQDVQIQVNYTVDGTGENAMVAFYYILETGAGWNDTIGSADLIVRLPYDANVQNVIMDETGFSRTSMGARLGGHDLLWHYENLEPTREDNLEVSLVTPQVWQAILDGRQATSTNPNDGEAWGQLGKACKEAILLRRGLRADPGGVELYQEAVHAYTQAVGLLPDDALWHLGFADLLWNQFVWNSLYGPNPDYALLEQALGELNAALSLSPSDERITQLADWIKGALQGMAYVDDSGQVVFIATPTPWPTLTPLPRPTATPTPTPRPTRLPATSTPLPTATRLPSPVPTFAPQALEPTAAPTPTPTGASLPFCGSAVIVPIFVTFVWMEKHRRA